jgi:phosphoserine phosphatase
LREGKVHKLQHWLAVRRLGWDGIHLTFYSDSINDLPLLEKAQEPVATNPDAALRALAADRGWRILDLFPTR